MVRKSDSKRDHVTVVEIPSSGQLQDTSSKSSTFRKKSRQRQEALHIVDDEQFEAFLVSQGCKIQSTGLDNLNSSSDTDGDSEDEVIYENLRPFYNIKRTPEDEIELLKQNVGVSGTVCMVSDPNSGNSKPYEVVLENISGPYSLVSVEEKIVENNSSPKHSTTILIGEKRPRGNSEESYTKCETETKDYQDQCDTINIRKKDDYMYLKWRIIPPEASKTSISTNDRNIIQQDANIQTDEEMERGSTPSSFSSAYTVTEKGLSSEASTSDSSTRRSESGSENNSNCDCDSWSDGYNSIDHIESTENSVKESNEDIKPTFPISDVKISIADIEIPPWSPDLISKDEQTTKEPDTESIKSNDSSQSKETNIDNGYIPNKEEREKGDEELWVSNEAAYPEGVVSEYSGSNLSLPPPVLPPSWWGHDNASEDANTPVSSLTPDEARPCIEVYDMAAIISPPSVNKTNFSKRQRSVDINANIELDNNNDENVKNENIENNQKAETNEPTVSSITSIITNRPTKRFSFIIRSNSLKESSSKSENISPSDRAILERLAELNLDGSCPVKTNQCSDKVIPKGPPCVRCGSPVYPPERLSPGPESLFHTSCFKCNICGVKLTLKTFYKNPKNSEDLRVFCKSHVPSLQAFNQEPSTTEAGKSNSSLADEKCEKIGLRYF